MPPQFIDFVGTVSHILQECITVFTEQRWVKMEPEMGVIHFNRNSGHMCVRHIRIRNHWSNHVQHRVITGRCMANQPMKNADMGYSNGDMTNSSR